MSETNGALVHASAALASRSGSRQDDLLLCATLRGALVLRRLGHQLCACPRSATNPRRSSQGSFRSALSAAARGAIGEVSHTTCFSHHDLAQLDEALCVCLPAGAPCGHASASSPRALRSSPMRRRADPRSPSSSRPPPSYHVVAAAASVRTPSRSRRTATYAPATGAPSSCARTPMRRAPTCG